MESEIIRSVFILIFLIFCSGYFSATETAFTSINKIKMSAEAEEGDKKSQLVMKLYENYDKLLSGILIGNNIVNIGASSVATIMFLELFPTYGATIATAVITILVLIFGEISPKTIAKEHPEKVSKLSAPFINFLIKVLTPFIFLFTKLTDVLTRVFKSPDKEEVSDAELLYLVDEAEETGNLSNYERDLIRSAIKFDDLELNAVLIPRVDVVAVDIEADDKVILNKFLESNFSRLIVYEDNIDNILGLMHEKDFTRYLLGVGKIKSVKDCVKKVLFVPETMTISTLLSQMQKNYVHMAAVKDEYGGTVGIVTMEDILEELVGEIWDESDKVEKDLIMLDPHTYIVQGTVSLEKILDIYEIKVDEELVSDTVGGFITEKLGHIPNDRESISYKNLKMTVLAMQDTRVLKVRIERVTSI